MLIRSRVPSTSGSRAIPSLSWPSSSTSLSWLLQRKPSCLVDLRRPRMFHHSCPNSICARTLGNIDHPIVHGGCCYHSSCCCCRCCCVKNRGEGIVGRRQLSSSSSLSTAKSMSPKEMIRRLLPKEGHPVDAIPPPIANLVQEYAAKPLSDISLLDLMKTGREKDDVTERLEHEWILAGRHPYRRRVGSASAASSGWAAGATRRPGDGRQRVVQRLAAEKVLTQYASMLQQELPIRLARCIVDLDVIPKLRDMPSIQSVKGVYLRSFLDLLHHAMPESSSSQDGMGERQAEAAFGRMLGGLYKKHSTVLLQMAQGAHEYRTATTQRNIKVNTSQGGEEDCQAFLDRFYTSRVGIRVLAGQYLALREQLLDGRYPDGINDDDDDHGGYVGMICKRTSPYQIVQRATHDATRLCVDLYGHAPDVHISGRLDLTFCYIPTHVHYILSELLKNAMRATMDHYLAKKKKRGTTDVNGEVEEDDDDEDGTIMGGTDDAPRRHLAILNRHIVQQQQQLQQQQQRLRRHHHVYTTFDGLPPVTVIIADSPDNEDVTIKVSDEGGGIPRSQMDDIWSYLYTTADPDVQERILKPMATTNTSPSSSDAVTAGTAALASSPILSGLGFGLPMSRAHARYFGGDLDLVSLQGYGTDAYCYLVRLEDGSSTSSSSSSSPSSKSFTARRTTKTTMPNHMW